MASVSVLIRKAGSFLKGTLKGVDTSAGTADVGKLPILNASGVLDTSFLPRGLSTLNVDVTFSSGAGAPVDGTTGANVAGIGSVYIDLTGKKWYFNGGTKAVPAWKLVTSA